MLARMRVVARTVCATMTLRNQRRVIPTGATAILVYGHPYSNHAGRDAYFGTLMQKLPHLYRILHTDSAPRRALMLAVDGRTVSLHAWGNLLLAATLLFVRWQPSTEILTGPWRWLVQRAAVIENSGGGPAMNRWQIICQERCLKEKNIKLLAWPWENHPWERALVRIARVLGVTTIGYMHTPFGPHHLELSNRSNPDGNASVPDHITCTGQIVADALVDWGHDSARLTIGGTLRPVVTTPLSYDSAGPIVFALPNDAPIASEMADLALTLVNEGRRVLVKLHPMAKPDMVAVPPALCARGALRELGGIAAVVFASSSIGLEAIIGGLPVIRFRPKGGYAPIAALLPGVNVESVEANDIRNALARLRPTLPRDGSCVFAPPDIDLWLRLLGPPTFKTSIATSDTAIVVAG
jgi:hypothetical protein